MKPQWKIKAQAFAQKLADLLEYEVWVAMDHGGRWAYYTRKVHPSRTGYVWMWARPHNMPSQGSPRNWKNTLVHATPKGAA